jgi:galactose oxidase
MTRYIDSPKSSSAIEDFHARRLPRPVPVLVTAALCAMVGLAALGDPVPPDEPAGPYGTHAPHLVPAAVSAPTPLPRTGWIVNADSEETAAGNHVATNAVDGDATTHWRSAGSAALPHVLTIDLGDRIAISGLTYLPPTSVADGRIGQYRVEISLDGGTWSTVATGTFADDATQKTAAFGTVLARLVRLVALTEAGARGPLTAVAEVDLLGGVDPPLARTGWTVTATSQETVSQNNAAANALDGNTATIWHSRWGGTPDPLPHSITIDMATANLVSGLSYLPRQDGSRNGNIGQYRVETSANGTAWGTAATGVFVDSIAAKTVAFDATIARYVRLTALTEAGGRGPWASAAELNLLGRADPTLARTGWIATATSQETVRENGAAGNVLDGNVGTIWHSKWGGTADPLPHTLTIDTLTNQGIGGLTYLPRPPASGNGRIGRYRIQISADATTWTTVVANGTFADTPSLKTVTFPAATGRYVRLVALTEAGNRGPWSSAAEVNLLGPSGVVVLPSRGAFAAPTGFPLVPATAALLPNGRVLTWSSFATDRFGGTGQTVTAVYDPIGGTVTQRTVTETGHDMFCPGTSITADGRVIVTGGDDSAKTSIFEPATNTWTTGARLVVPRGYQSSVTLSDGRVFTIGGSWSGGRGGKDAEVWSDATGWQRLTDAPVAPMLTADVQGVYRADNHSWLFAWSGGTVLQAGPSKAMNWYGTTGTGSTAPAGLRADDGDAMNGNAVMYDAGKILTVGGAANYQNSNATANAYVITINGTSVTTRKVTPMAYPRAFHNSVVLADGKVAVFGGQSYPVPFSDNTAVLTTEIWDPATETFATAASAAVPRTYHSVALLLPDGRVFTGGGGLCGTGCAANHFDGEIFTPPNLLNPDGTPAARPVITSAPATAAHGTQITVTTDRAVTGFSLVRFGSTTHTVNTDQRRIGLVPTPAGGGGYQLTIPADPGIAVPGYYMLFALDAHGVPSVAHIVRVG